MTRRRVVVTGLGIVSPVGNTVSEAWSNLTAGRSGIRTISKFDASEMPCQIAGEVRDLEVNQYLNPKEVRRMDTFIHFGLIAAIQAIQDAGLKANPEDAERQGVCIGSGIGGLPMITDTHTAYLEGGVRKISPFFIPGSIINMISGNLSIMYGLKGPNVSLVTACTTGNHSIGDAARLIEYGDADVMIAGGAEAAINDLGIGGFCAA
ncbi:MAG: beta-ketoacyl-ACP synthase II, partial [Betaproteobacteria bacterium]|nr:beta-ketoacyl-ACP synthase II [Betaproteobacteria bacterium]